MSKRLRRIRAAGVGNRQAGTTQPAHGRNLLLSIINLARVHRLLCFEDGVDTLGGNDAFAFEVEDKRRILSVEYHDINLLAERSVAIDNMCLLSPIAKWQICLEQFEPDVLARVSLRHRR